MLSSSDGDDLYLSNLLPYAENSYIDKRITIFKIADFLSFIIDNFNKATNDFMNYNMTAFDPHVGESLCQIRACYILDFFNIYYDDAIYIKSIRALNDELNKIAKRIFSIKIKFEGLNKVERVNLTSFLKLEGVNIKIEKTFFYIFICHFLTRFVTFNSLENSIIDYNKMEIESGLSKNFLRRVIHFYQKLISQLSCNYIITINEKYNKSIIKRKTIDLLVQIDDDGRHILPLYVVTTIIFNLIEKKQIGIMVVFRGNSFDRNKLHTNYYEYDIKKEKYIIIDCLKIKEKKNCIVMHVQTDYNVFDQHIAEEITKTIDKIGLKNCILANMASHPQYSGRKLAGLNNFFLTPIMSSSSKSISDDAALISNDYIKHKLIAEKYGCSEHNQALFYIRHIFCDYISHQMSLTEDGVFYCDNLKKMTYNKEEGFKNFDPILIDA